VSDLCGGGMWNLAPLSSSDIVSFVDGQAYLFVNPCGVVKNASCTNLGASVCYAYLPLVVPPSNDYDIANYDPVHAPITYTLLSNGVLATHVDGAYCGNNVNVPRTVYISYLCDTSKAQPVITNYTSTNCQYWVTIATQVVCTQAYSNAPYVPSSTAVGSTTAVSTSTGASALPPPTGATGTSIPNNPNGGGGGSGLSGGAIAGIAIGSIVGALIVLAVLYLFCCGMRRDKKDGGGFDTVGTRPVSSREAEPSGVEMSQVDQEGEADVATHP